MEHPDVLSNVESLATVIALIVGGWWTYTTFIRGRERYPRAELTHVVRDQAFGRGRRLLQVRLEVKNIGGTLMRVNQVDARVQRVAPLRDGEISEVRDTSNLPWPLVDRRLLDYTAGSFEIEPGEADWIEFDFALDEPLEVVRVYTYLANAAKAGRLRKKRAIGWRQASYHKIGAPSPQAQKHEASIRGEEEQAAPEPLPGTQKGPQRRPVAPPDRRQGLPERLPTTAPAQRPKPGMPKPTEPMPQGEPEPLPPANPTPDDEG